MIRGVKDILRIGSLVYTDQYHSQYILCTKIMDDKYGGYELFWDTSSRELKIIGDGGWCDIRKILRIWNARDGGWLHWCELLQALAGELPPTWIDGTLLDHAIQQLTSLISGDCHNPDDYGEVLNILRKYKKGSGLG